MTVNTFEEITTSKPYKPLTMTLKKHAGRNNTGRLTIRHQGSGHAQRYRMVDFFYTDKKGIEAKVETIEYDPYRTAFIALVCYKDGERRYVVAHTEMKVGDVIITEEKAKLVSGNRMEIGNIPTGLEVHNVELIVGQGASSVRSAGSMATIVSQEGEYTQVKMPSGEIRLEVRLWIQLIIHMVVEKEDLLSVWKHQKLHGGKLLLGRKQEVEEKLRASGFSKQDTGNLWWNNLILYNNCYDKKFKEMTIYLRQTRKKSTSPQWCW